MPVLQTMPVTRFHHYHGQNIRMLEDNKVAYRETSFAHAIGFSDRPLQPGELFLVEIEKNERGWSGHLRIGVTQHDPNTNFSLPQYALPDLTNMGKAWIFAVTKSHNKVYTEDMEWTDGESILGEGEFVHTSCGSFLRSLILPNKRAIDGASGNILPTDVGSKIGVMYVINNDKAEMHFIINGEDQGPCARDIPYKDGPLYVVVDVYGTTKQVRIMQLYEVGSLQNACREAIIKNMCKADVSNLPLPTKIKEYLRYEV